MQVELDQLEGLVANQHRLPARVGGVEGHLKTERRRIRIQERITS
jgi:hypothetical protein